MNTFASASYSLDTPMPEIDSLEKLVGLLQPHGELPLVFTYGGRVIDPGYHVTEVKAASLSSLDCGANPESWNETVIQLWDTDKDGATHMTAAKFTGILTQVGRRMAIDQRGLLVFEVGASVSPMQIFTVGNVDTTADRITVSLAPRPATCKPRERGLQAVAQETSQCCASMAGRSSCCG